MRKNRILMITALLLLLTLPPLSQAEQKGRMSVGLKSWYNTLDSKGLISDPTLSWGPTFAYMKKDWFAGVSYVKGEHVFNTLNPVNNVQTKTALQRSETDLFMGIQAASNLSLLIGAKYELVRREINGDAIGTDGLWRSVFAGRTHHTFYLASVPFTVFGTLSLVDGEFTGEVGSSTAVPTTAFNLYFGYKHQELGDNLNVSGPFIGVNYPLSR